jgi:hypothetical protein
MVNPFSRKSGDVAPTRFSDTPDGIALETAMRNIDQIGTPPRLQQAFDDVAYRVLDGVRRGTIALDYAPARQGLITIPPKGNPLHVQALVYWSVALGRPMYRVLEAARRCGDGANHRTVLDTINKIDREDVTTQTDRYFFDASGDLKSR